MRLTRIEAVLPAAALMIALLFQCAPRATAYPAFAKKEGKDCVYCHVEPGKARNFRGLYYKAHDNSFTDFDNEYEAKLAGVPAASIGPDATPKNTDYPDAQTNVPPVLKFTLKDIDGKSVNLARYKGQVILLVNVASKCGNTPQYASLEKIYTQYKSKGFVILAFPANEFGGQEPGTNKEIKIFCKSKYNVTFPVFSKIVVKGEKQAPLYKYLTDKMTDPKFGGDIDWNFAKFLVDREGNLVARFPAKLDPMKPEVVAAIEAELAKPKPGEDKAAGAR